MTDATKSGKQPVSLRFTGPQHEFFARLGHSAGRGRPSIEGGSARTLPAVLRVLVDRLRFVLEQEPLEIPQDELDAFFATGRSLPLSLDDIRTLDLQLEALSRYPRPRDQQEALLRFAQRVRPWSLVDRVRAAFTLDLYAHEVRIP